MQKGLLMVNTGNGKGKTTAALGLAMRAVGHHQKVCMIQFIKGTWKSGEHLAKECLSDNLDFHVLGNGFTWTSNDLDADTHKAHNAWSFAKEMLASDKYQLVILDELTYLINYGFVDRRDVFDCLANRREDLHVVVTGRDAPQALLDMADLVTEMIELKHPFKQGIKAQKGIEF
ncbi:cob(I)yrinic acid a,c-diamide adenosyltransferase [candidate division KSB3 bacterium]|uniref:Cob(I)yrinic acid a,c-diamide adenosyltransferase n=1 Tax=candidate division KSB3 bacterium TaxID=2044937 RepID=A0A9D5JZ65_9BACT|nr:cob(I)yrinic acid a,c-diamide adenosyltransferase [candidate division KSB3 bacterium]MBD3326456.1 cob(I)yrinic acid a,c-diamide adenosyltransferase [candidate division KSB3 bacterium]